MKNELEDEYKSYRTRFEKLIGIVNRSKYSAIQRFNFQQFLWAVGILKTRKISKKFRKKNIEFIIETKSKICLEKKEKIRKKKKCEKENIYRKYI